MQKWLSTALAQCRGLRDLIVNAEFAHIDDINDYYSARISSSISESLDSLAETRTIFENENISISQGETLKPDFVLYAPVTESIVVVELKNIKGPSREAGTELAAYSAEIRSAIPFIADGDIINVIVSAEWPALLLHYVRHQIIWQRKNVICLEPFKKDSGEIGLRVLTVEQIYEDVASIKIGGKHLGAFQLCLYDYTVDDNSLSKQHNLIDHFNTALRAMAVTGDRLNSHGFAFLWKDLAMDSVAPFSITIANFAPFQSIERLLSPDGCEPSKVVKRYMDLICENAPTGHSKTIWNIIKTGKALLNMVCGTSVEGYNSWREHERIMNGGFGRANCISFAGWGLFGEMHIKFLKEAYERGEFNIPVTDPTLGWVVIKEVIRNSDDDKEMCLF